MLAPLSLSAQFIEDGLRMSESNSIISARAGGLGVSFIGINDDASALRVNPAGLTLLPAQEINFGFAFRNLQTESNYNGQMFSQTPTNSFYLSNFVYASPMGHDNESTLAFGYFNEAQNDMRIEYNTFNQNPASSIIAQKPWLGDYLFVTDPMGRPLVTDSIQQDNFTRIEGGKHSIFLGGSWKVSDYASIGANVSPKWGNITMNRFYSETDILNKYDTYLPDDSSIDFTKLTLDQTVNTDYVGISGAVGFQVNWEDFLRFGGNIELPTYYNVTETYSDSYRVYYDNDPQQVNPGRYDNEVPNADFSANEYWVWSPAVFSGGASLHFLGATVSAAISYQDFSQMEFSADDYTLADVNRDIIRQLKGRTTYGVGAEYKFPVLPLTVRGSYEYFVSPFYEDGAEAAGATYAIGGSVLADENTSIDGVFRYRNFTNQSAYPGPDFRINNEMSPLTIAFGITYRFD